MTDTDSLTTWDDVDELIQQLKDEGYRPTLLQERGGRDYEEKAIELGVKQPWKWDY